MVIFGYNGQKYIHKHSFIMIFLSTQSFPRYGLDRIFAIAKAAGFDGIELTINDNYDTQNAEYLHELEKRHGIPVKAFALETNREEDLLEVFENLIPSFEGVTVNLTSSGSFSHKYKKWLKNTAPALARRFNLQINRRNTPFKVMFGLIPERSENSLYALREAGNVCLDLSALWASHEDIMRTINFLGDNLKHIALSNVHNGQHYMPLDKGLLPLESFLTKLAQTHYRQDFTLKIAPKNLPQGLEDDMIKVLIDSRKFYEQYFVESKKKVDGRSSVRKQGDQ